MKKYIIIAGVPRAGKSTVSKIIAKQKGYQLLPQDYKTFVENEKCEIFYFLSSDVTPSERYQILKTYDTPNDYTYYHSDEENMKDCIDIVTISNLIKEQCILCGLPYYETSRERENVIEDFICGLDLSEDDNG